MFLPRSSSGSRRGDKKRLVLDLDEEGENWIKHMYYFDLTAVQDLHTNLRLLTLLKLQMYA